MSTAALVTVKIYFYQFVGKDVHVDMVCRSFMGLDGQPWTVRTRYGFPHGHVLPSFMGPDRQRWTVRTRYGISHSIFLLNGILMVKFLYVF